MLKSNSLPKISKKTSADLFESVVGAIYLDGGYEKALAVVDRFVIVGYDNVKIHLENSEDAKTKLQELLQKQVKSWEYVTTNSYGLDHEKTFEVALFVDNKIVAKAEAKSLQQAQNECAKKYLKDVEIL